MPLHDRFVGQRFADDRGFLQCFNTFDPMKKGVRRFYVVTNHSPGFVRAWHGHANETKYVTCLRGTAIIGLMPIDAFGNDQLPKDIVPMKHSFESIQALGGKRYILSSEPRPLILKLPAGFANGSKILTPDAQLIYFSTSMVEESKQDDWRFSAQLFREMWNVEER